MQRGFTIVELLITLVVMVILLTLGVVGLRSVLANARDSERAADIDTIARGLEQYYDRGNPYVKPFGSGGFTTKGSYPGANEFIHIQGWNYCGNSFETALTNCFVSGGYVSTVLPGVSDAAMTPPGKSKANLDSTWLLDDATIRTRLESGTYIYKPLNIDGASGPTANGVCYGQSTADDSGSCPAFELMYIKETSTAAYPNNVVIVKSKHK